jgi:hypothetical protein
VVGRGCSPGAVAPPRLHRVRRVAEEPMRSRSPFLLIRPFASDTINRKGQESIFCQLIFEVLSDGRVIARTPAALQVPGRPAAVDLRLQGR